MKPKWMDKVETFEVMDVRKLRGNCVFRSIRTAIPKASGHLIDSIFINIILNQ